MILIDLIRNTEGEIYAKLSYNEEKNYLHMKWIGHCSEEELKAASMQMFKWQRAKGSALKCRVHIHDTKEMQGAWAGQESVKWISDYFFKINYEFGLRYNISILSPDMFTKLTSHQLQKRASKVPTILFNTLSQAEQWLEKKGVPCMAY